MSGYQHDSQKRKFVDKDGVRRQRVSIAFRIDDLEVVRKRMKTAGKAILAHFLEDLVRQQLRSEGVKRYEDPIYAERRNRPSRRVVLTRTRGGIVRVD